MTAYFDSRGAEFLDIQKKFQGCTMEKWLQFGLPLLEKLDSDVVFDVTVATGFPGFPTDLAERVHKTVLKYSSACQPVNAKHGPEYDEPWQHIQGIGNMLSDLHTIFHDVARRALPMFSDDPRAPIRSMYANGEEVRENLVEPSGGGVLVDDPEHPVFYSAEELAKMTDEQKVDLALKTTAIAVPPLPEKP